MGMIGDISSAIGSYGASKKQRKLTRQYIAELDKYGKEFRDLSADFQTQFRELSNNFDIYDLQNEFDSLYEAVIAPMEMQFSESVLPQIRQSYSGGGYGSQLFTGGRESTEAEARQKLSMNEALLKMQARETGINRNISEYGRRFNDLNAQYKLGIEPINFDVALSGAKYGANLDKIAAKAAATSAIGGAVDTTVTTLAQAIAGGMGAGMGGVGAGAAGAGATGGGMDWSTVLMNMFNAQPKEK